MSSKISPLAPAGGFPNLPEIQGVEFATAAAGIKYAGRDDVMLAKIEAGATVAGVFTRSATRSAPVLDCQEKLAQGVADGPIAILVNSGNANAFTGSAGSGTVETVCNAVAEVVGTTAKNVFTASTGVIGEPLDASKITNVLIGLNENLSEGGIDAAAKAIMTTDTFAKGASAECQIGGKTVQIAGIAKGSGMIAPDMATMLVYIFTDAAVDAGVLQALLSAENETSFNCITVDSDTSTSDSLMLVATGKSAAPVIDDLASSEAKTFAEGLRKVMLDLAHQVVRDGEGASKFVTVQVTGAASDASAKTIGLAIANSPLVKTAIAGEDPNWGRVVMAVGKSGEPADRDRLAIWFGDILVAEKGWVSESYTEETGATYMRSDELQITADIGVGTGKATVWTCDLTHQYITINADYRS